jgi:cysteinyl-tRNA synthetase
MDDLGLLRPSVEPRATDHVGEMLSLIATLIERGAAYAVDGDVFFSVAAFPTYGRLSGQDVNQVRSGARIDVDERKRAPEDFALWKSTKPDEPSWPSPWGPGRPGWHIECSAMAAKHLGVPFDIHGGGSDLVFPHHENEIAQSEAASGTAFARVWMHNGMIRVNQEKMSKSLGNFSTIHELLKVYDAESIRVFLMSQHYRSPVEFSFEAMEESRKSVARTYAALARVDRGDWGGGARQISPSGPGTAEPGDDCVESVEPAFREAMDDDLNTARAMAVLFDAVRSINRLADRARGSNAQAVAAEARRGREVVSRLGGEVLGIFGTDPEVWLKRDRDRRVAQMGLSVDWIVEQVEARSAARSEKRWADADAIRQSLAACGVVLEDRPGGTTEWSVADPEATESRADGE